jgi:hypothetical protein
MSSIEYSEKLKDPRWQKRRLKIFERDNWVCQLCSRTDLELHVHHLYRTTEDPWDEPDLHLLTLCKLCHEQQLANPHGGFKPPNRLYKTDDEWWDEHSKEYDRDLRLELAEENIHGRTIRDVFEKIRQRDQRIHALRLAWEEKRESPPRTKETT